MARTLMLDGSRYLMRDQRSKAQILQQRAAFRAKYPNTKTTFDEWLNRGRVYLRLPQGVRGKVTR